MALSPPLSLASSSPSPSSSVIIHPHLYPRHRSLLSLLSFDIVTYAFTGHAIYLHLFTSLIMATYLPVCLPVHLTIYLPTSFICTGSPLAQPGAAALGRGPAQRRQLRPPGRGALPAPRAGRPQPPRPGNSLPDSRFCDPPAAAPLAKKRGKLCQALPTTAALKSECCQKNIVAPDGTAPSLRKKSYR